MRLFLFFPSSPVFTSVAEPPSRATDVEGTDLLSEEHLTDINDIAAVLKLWFRELPEPLLTWELYHQFIDVASAFPPSRFELTTGLTDPTLLQKSRTTDCDTSGYTSASTTCRIRTTRRSSSSWVISTSTPTLPLLPFSVSSALLLLDLVPTSLSLIHRIHSNEHQNQMSITNLAIVFGPNLLGPPPAHLAAHYPPPPSSSSANSAASMNGGGGGGGSAAPGETGSLADMQWQSKTIETILRHYQEIFVE